MRFSAGELLVGSQVLPLATKAASEERKREKGEDTGDEFSDTDRDSWDDIEVFCIVKVDGTFW